MTITLKSRRTIVDNIGTRDHPTPRHRIATPLTPRAVRIQMLEAPEWLDEPRAAQWLEERRAELPAMLTELDRLLTDEEADTLERYIDNEELLTGNVRCADYLQERVYGGGRPSGPLSDDDLEALKGHADMRKRLGVTTRGVLLIFFSQQTGMDGAPNDAQAAALVGMIGGRKGKWHRAVRRAAQALVAIGY